MDHAVCLGVLVFTVAHRAPADKKVVVVCRAGIRSAVIATGLRHIGFENVYILHKGTMALADYLTPSKVN